MIDDRRYVYTQLKQNIFQALISQLLKFCITAVINHVFTSFSVV